MSESIESVIKSCLQGSGIEYTPSDGTALTLEHQLINTWCWLNIRVSLRFQIGDWNGSFSGYPLLCYSLQESSLLLGRLVTLIPANCSEENLPISVDTVRDIGSTFIKILTSCRHRVRPFIPSRFLFSIQFSWLTAKFFSSSGSYRRMPSWIWDVL